MVVSQDKDCVLTSDVPSNKLVEALVKALDLSDDGLSAVSVTDLPAEMGWGLDEV